MQDDELYNYFMTLKNGMVGVHLLDFLKLNEYLQGFFFFVLERELSATQITLGLLSIFSQLELILRGLSILPPFFSLELSLISKGLV